MPPHFSSTSKERSNTIMPDENHIASDNKSGSLVIEDNERAELYVRTIQQVYSQIHKQSSEMSSYHKDPYVFSLNEIENLHQRIINTIDTYNVKAINCKFKIYYHKDVTDTLESIEDFKLKSSGRGTYVENISITYNFMIMPTNQEFMRKLTRKDDEIVQNYNINVRINSRVAIRHSITNSITHAPSRIFRIFSDPSLMIRIKYVDYTIARSIMSNLEDWANTVPKNENKYIVNKLMNNIDIISRGIMYLAPSIFFIIFFIESIKDLSATPNFSNLYTLTCLTFIIFFYLTKIGRGIARCAEDVVIDLSEESIIILNKADENLDKYQKNHKKFGIFFAIISPIITVILGIASSFIFEILKYVGFEIIK